MTFAHPLAFLLILPLIFVAYRLFRKTKTRGFAFPSASKINAPRTFRQRLYIVPPILFILGSIFLIIALARPQERLTKSSITTESIAIEMAIDISGSMNARDLSNDRRKNRLDVVKETFNEFIEKRPSDLIGIVTFGGYATTRAPLTTDHTALKEIMNKNVNIPPENELLNAKENRTAIGDGLALACSRLNKVTNIKSRIVILLSDGENNEGIIDPLQAAQIASDMNIKVYAIGIYSPTFNPFMGMMAPIGPRQYQNRTLTAIAEKTKGRYFNVQDKNSLNKVLEEIDQMEKTKINENIYLNINEKFAPYLICGIVLILLATLFRFQKHKGIL